MTRNLIRPVRRGACFAAAAMLAAAPVGLAQPSDSKKNEPLKPPVAQQGSSSSAPVVPMLVGVVLGALVVGVCFIPSKRGHQD